MGWVIQVVMGGRKTSLIDLRVLLMLGWAVQLSRAKATFLFYLEKILSRLYTQVLKRFLVIQAFLLA